MLEELTDAFRHFAPSGLLESYEGDIVIVLMHPLDFLKLASPISSRIASQARCHVVHDLLRDGTPFSSLCTLGLDVDDDDETTGYVMAHDGRHRAMVLARQGVTAIPVVLETDTIGLTGVSVSQLLGLQRVANCCQYLYLMYLAKHKHPELAG